MRVIVSGNRGWKQDWVVYRALTDLYREHGVFHLVHGDCSTGADAQAEHWYHVAGRYLGCTREKFPAAWETRGRAAGPERNVRMVQAGANLLLAFPLPRGTGTQQTIDLAKKARIKVIQYQEERYKKEQA